MAQAKRAFTELYFDEETTYGSDPGSPAARLWYFNSEALGLNINLIDDESISATRRQSKQSQGNRDVSGTITFPVNPFTGTLLKHCLGTVATTGASPYVHTMKVGDLPTSLIIEKHIQDLTVSPAFEQHHKYNGCRLNNLNISMSSEGILLATVDVLGQKETLGGGTPYDATVEDKTNVPFTMANVIAANIEEGGSALATITAFDFTIANNLDGDMFVIGGAGLRQSIPEGKVLVSGNLTAYYDSVTLYNKALNLTESSLKITFSLGDGLGSAGNESLELFIPEIVYETNTPTVEENQGGVMVEMPFRAYFQNSSEASDIQFILKNTDATI